MRRQAGQPAKLPHSAYVHMVAARYGTSPEAVRDWPATDFLDACNYLGLTRER